MGESSFVPAPAASPAPRTSAAARLARTRLSEHVLTGRTTFGALVEAAESAVKAAEAA